MPKLTERYHLNFYGGEPLLSYEYIRRAVELSEQKNIQLNKHPSYSITTNASLITSEIIRFFDEHSFSVVVSFDGLAQNLQRDQNSFDKIIENIRKLLSFPRIKLKINSVFTPESVGLISDSVKFLLNLNVPNIHISFSTIRPWERSSILRLENELQILRGILLTHYKMTGKIPVENFRKRNSKGIFQCAAGKDRLAITPDGLIWGCFLFPDYFKSKEHSPEYQKFCFGNLDDFISDSESIHSQIYSNYKQLTMANFTTPKKECFLCSELESCTVCPVNAAFAGLPLGQVPEHICAVQKIRIKEREKFWNGIIKLTDH